MQKPQPSWSCRTCAARASLPPELPGKGAVCACGATPTYLDVLAALNHQAESDAQDALELSKGVGEGQWWPSRDENGQRGSAMLRCPQCGRPAFLYAYEIDAEGLVRPAFACDAAGCTFERALRLAGWSPAR